MSSSKIFLTQDGGANAWATNIAPGSFQINTGGTMNVSWLVVN
jgi:hypothetical protein